MRKIKKGDLVIVIAGKDKGRTGTVLSVVDKGNKALVEDVNKVKKAVKPNPNINEQGGIISKEKPIHISNIAIYNTKTKKADRVGIRVENGRKVRYFKSTNEIVGEI